MVEAVLLELLCLVAGNLFDALELDLAMHAVSAVQICLAVRLTRSR